MREQAKGRTAERTYFEVSKFLSISKTENNINHQSLLSPTVPSVSTGTFALPELSHTEAQPHTWGTHKQPKREHHPHSTDVKTEVERNKVMYGQLDRVPHGTIYSPTQKILSAGHWGVPHKAQSKGGRARMSQAMIITHVGDGDD